MENNKALTVKGSQITQQLNSAVTNVISSEKLSGFEKAYLMADAIEKLKTLLTPEYMKPIMLLQGTKLGFRTDKDGSGGYSEEVVKNCLIEAVLKGFQPTDNQFNIIAGNMYGTREGFTYLLSKIEGLEYIIKPNLPRIGAAEKQNSAAVIMNIWWKYQGKENTQEIDFPIKVNNFMGADAVIGKAERKARAWLYKTITGNDVGEGDASTVDVQHEDVTGSEAAKKAASDASAKMKEKVQNSEQGDLLNQQS